MSDSVCDSILMQVVIRLSWIDRIRVLCGREIRVTTWGIEELVDKPEVLDALAVVESQTFIGRLFYLRSRGGYATEEDHSQ